MKKRNITGPGGPAAFNPVAKFAPRFNRAAIFKDKKAYARKAKHVVDEGLPVSAMPRPALASPYRRQALPVRAGWRWGGFALTIFRGHAYNRRVFLIWG